MGLFIAPKGTTAVQGIPIGKLNSLQSQINNIIGGALPAWSTPPESPAPDGSVTVFTVGSSAPTDVVSDGTFLFNGFGYTYTAGHITLVNGPTQFIRYR